MTSFKERVNRLIGRGKMHETRLQRISASDWSQVTPEEAAIHKEITWFEQGKKCRAEADQRRAVATAKKLKEAKPFMEFNNQLRGQIEEKVEAIRNLNLEEISSEGVKLGFELLDLTEQSNKVNHTLNRLGFGFHIFDKIPNDVASMLIYIQKIRNREVFR